MDVSLIPQVIANGLMMGMTYVLIASGLTIVLGITRIINFAHGEFYMLGAFCAYYFFERAGVPYLVTIFLAILAVGAFGMLVERVAFRPIREFFIPSIVVALGLAFFLSGGAALVFGPEEKVVTSPFPGVLNFLGATFSVERLVVILIALVIMGALWYLVARTKLGRALRSVAQDREAAALQGISVNWMCNLSMGIGCGLAGAAGVLLAPIFIVHPFLGSGAIIKALLVIILGGIGSMPGAVVGGLMLGFIESFGLTYLGGITEVLLFVIIFLLILFRPGGLMGRVLEIRH